MIARAFAHDDMELDFQKLKAKALEEELPSIDVNADGSLPGWGQWGGDGTSLNSPMIRFSILGVVPPKPSRSKQARLEALKQDRLKQRKKKLEARKDKNLQHVIIHEETIKESLPTKYYAVCFLEFLPFFSFDSKPFRLE